MFEVEHLRSQLSKIPSDEKNAIVLGVTNDGVRVSALVVNSNGWRVRAIYEHSWDGNDSISGEVIFHW